jgi:hypothetical protein
MLDRTPSLLLRALAIAAVVCVLIPSCSMAASAIHVDLASMLECESMWFTSDAEGGILVSLISFAVLAVFAVAIAPRTFTQATPLFAAHHTVDPHPPDDPLVGRLIV